MKNKYQILYVMVLLVGTIAISYSFNQSRLLINSHVRAYDKTYSKYPEPTFFEIEDVDYNKIERPLLKDVKQFRNGSLRTGFYDVSFDPDRLNPLEISNIKPVNFGAHSASKSSPMNSKNFIILAGDYGLIQVLNKKDLSVHWTIELFDSDRGVHNTPIAFSDYSFVGDYSGKLYFLDLMNKKLIWVIDLGDALGATPYFDGEYLYANVELSSPVNGYIAKIDPFAKKIIWMSKVIGEQSHSSPTAKDGSLFFGDNDGDFYRMSQKTGLVEWKKSLGKPIKSTPAFYKDKLIFSSWDKVIYCLDQKTGRVAWIYPLPNENQSSMAIDVELSIGYINSSIGIHKIYLNTGASIDIKKIIMSSESSKASPVILKFKRKKRIITSCKISSLCVFNENLELLKEFQLSYGVSNQTGVFEDSILAVGDRMDSFLYLKSQNEPEQR